MLKFKWSNMFVASLIFPSASFQVTTYPISQARLLSHQLRPRTGSIRLSRRSAAAHWPIRGAQARRPQPAWRLTCRVRRNASSCRTAGSWAAMWPWRAGEWPEASTTTFYINKLCEEAIIEIMAWSHYLTSTSFDADADILDKCW